MYNSKKLFVGGLNTDDETRLIGQDQYLNLENLRIAISEFGRNFRIENIPLWFERYKRRGYKKYLVG